MEANADSMLRLKYPKKVIIGYIDINSIRNKFEYFSQMIGDKLDVVTVSETKPDSSFPNNQFRIRGFKPPIRLDINKSSGGLLVYIKENPLCKKIEDFGVPNDIQTIPIGINTRKQEEKKEITHQFRAIQSEITQKICNIC